METKRITEEWKEKAIATLMLMHPDKEEQIRSYVDSIRPSVQPIGKFRNLYEREEWVDEDLDNIRNLIYSSGLSVGGNGSYSDRRKDNEVVDILVDMGKKRKKFKALREEAHERGDEAAYASNDILQNYQKVNMNAFYGGMLQSGSFVYNPDSATFITVQGRELISHISWTIEALIAGNVPIANFSEFTAYLQTTIDNVYKDNDINTFNEYVTYRPTDEEVKERLLSTLIQAPDGLEKSKVYESFIDNFVKNSSTFLKTRVYYKDNMIGLVSKNPKVQELIKHSVTTNVEFMNPNDVPKAIKKEVDKFIDIVRVYVYNKLLMCDKIEKYRNFRRRYLIGSDTDSVMVHLGKWVDRINEVVGRPGYDQKDEPYLFRVVNTLCLMITKVSDDACSAFCENSNVPDAFHDRINMKNEYFWKTMLLLLVKKNYASWERIKEGMIRDEISYTGLKFVGSNLSDFTKKEIDYVCSEMILKKPVDQIDPIAIYQRIQKDRDLIKEYLLNGEVSFGMKKNYRASGDVLKDVGQADRRASMLWNVLYPNDPIHSGDKIYTFYTVISTESDLSLIKDEEMRDNIRRNIFQNEEIPTLGCKGLSHFAVPMRPSLNKIPEWLISIIDMDRMIDYHLSTLIDILPSLNIYKTKKKPGTRLLSL